MHHVSACPSDAQVRRNCARIGLPPPTFLWRPRAATAGQPQRNIMNGAGLATPTATEVADYIVGPRGNGAIHYVSANPPEHTKVSGVVYSGATQITLLMLVNWDNTTQDTIWGFDGCLHGRQKNFSFSNLIFGLDNESFGTAAHFQWGPSHFSSPLVGTLVVSASRWYTVALSTGPDGRAIVVDGQLDAFDTTAANLEDTGADPAIVGAIGAWIDDGDNFGTGHVGLYGVWRTALPIATMMRLTSNPWALLAVPRYDEEVEAAAAAAAGTTNHLTLLGVG